MRWILLVVMVLGLAGNPVIAQDDDLEPGEWREKESFGLGFGLALGFGLGVQAYLDYNLASDKQLHFLVASQSIDRVNVFGATRLRTTQSSATGTFRYFPKPTSGWFLGGGLSSLTVTQESADSAAIDSEASSVAVVFDGGWQGWDGYYFTINLILGEIISEDVTDNTNTVSDLTNNREIAKEDFDAAQSPGGIMFGFGWYLQ